MSNLAQEGWYRITNVGELDSPALVFYRERIAANIATLIASIDDIGRLRPHVKTHKNAELTLALMAAGIQKYKCATIAEAEMLAICGAADVLLAYQPVGPKILRLIALINAYPKTQFSCLVDNEQSAAAIAAAAAASGMVISVYMDLNVGMNRTGIIPGETALQLYRFASEQSDLKVCGLHAYDGHIHDASMEVRREKWQRVLDAVLALKTAIVSGGMANPVIVAGGTPTYPLYAAVDGIECSPGTFILWDKGYQDAFTEQAYLTAALVITRIISLTGGGRVTVDLGHKAVAAENELGKRVFFLNAPEAQMLSQSEEHLVLVMDENHGFAIGDVLYGLPVHICPTVALYAKASCIEGQQVTEEWNIISRDRRINI